MSVAAQHAEVTTQPAQQRYSTDVMCVSSSPAGTARYAVTITRESDGKTAPARSNLLVKRNGYASAAGLGSWATMREAEAAITAEAVRWLEARQ